MRHVKTVCALMLSLTAQQACADVEWACNKAYDYQRTGTVTSIRLGNADASSGEQIFFFLTYDDLATHQKAQSGWYQTSHSADSSEGAAQLEFLRFAMLMRWTVNTACNRNDPTKTQTFSLSKPSDNQA